MADTSITTVRLSDKTREEINAAILDVTAAERRLKVTQDEVILRAVRLLRENLRERAVQP